MIGECGGAAVAADGQTSWSNVADGSGWRRRQRRAVQVDGAQVAGEDAADGLEGHEDGNGAGCDQRAAGKDGASALAEAAPAPPPPIAPRIRLCGLHLHD